MRKITIILATLVLGIYSCESAENTSIKATTHASQEATSTQRAARGGQETIVDEVSKPDIVKLAVSNKDLTTLVKAVQAADLTTSLSNAGPFTVFAPLNSAFDKLPKGTLDDLMKPENKDKLDDILRHHTYVGVINADQLRDGQILGMVDGNSIKIQMKDGKPTINGNANIVGSVTAANGVVHVIDEVILVQ